MTKRAAAMAALFVPAGRFFYRKVLLLIETGRHLTPAGYREGRDPSRSFLLRGDSLSSPWKANA
jgi:hypothetical protein